MRSEDERNRLVSVGKYWPMALMGLLLMVMAVGALAALVVVAQ